MWIRKSKITELSQQVKRLISGEAVDIRDHREGPLQILKNDIQTLANQQREEVKALADQQHILKDTLADISHQLKTPLTSMMIMADLLEDAPPLKRSEFIHNIQASLHHTEWLVSAFLKMAKLDAHTVDFQITEVPSQHLLQTAIAPMKIMLELRNQQITISGEQLFHCDKRWTAEALGNIIKNASEHSPVDSTIHIEVGSNPISSWIKVTDAGPGMDRAQIAKLFKRFEGSHNAKGYGIGLPLALSIMKNQFGDIEVDGGKGRGAAFTLKFYQNK